MGWRRYRAGYEWIAPTHNWGLDIGWGEMLLGVSVDVGPSTVYVAVGLGPIFVWVNIGG